MLWDLFKILGSKIFQTFATFCNALDISQEFEDLNDFRDSKNFGKIVLRICFSCWERFWDFLIWKFFRISMEF